MEKLIKIVSSPFSPSMEVVDKLVIKLDVPYSEQEVAILINPNIQHYVENNDRSDVKIAQLTLSTDTDQTKKLTFDFKDKNIQTFEVENKKYEMKLMNIGKERIEEQYFPWFEFSVKSL